MAAEALRAGDAGGRRAGEVLAAIERPARAAGAEEAMVHLCPDLGARPALRRIEGEAALGIRFAAQLSVAYKGVWVRLARSFAPGVERPGAWSEADRWFAQAIAACEAATPGEALGRMTPGRLVGWNVEACVGALPLAVVAASGTAPPPRPIPAGSLAVVTVRLETEAGPWIGGSALVLGGEGKLGRALAGA
jgi:hypothetical protein